MTGRDPDVVPFFVEPPRQLYSATFQLAAIANALEAGDIRGARQCLLSIDLEACRLHWTRSGDEAWQRHRKERHEDRTAAKRSHVGSIVRLQIGDRDGWRCRYCALPVVWPGYFKALFAIDFGPLGEAVNDLWRVFAQSPDHVVPVAAGGADAPTNLVTACGTCNYSKSSCSLEELGLDDPRTRQPIRDGWTGLVGRPRTT